MRIALGIEYDGSGYNGWQRQSVGIGVQQRLEHALTAVAGHEILVQGAGRTDAGVHATGQVAHFDSDSQRGDRGWLLGANTNLPDDISVTWVRAVPETFHARFSALQRSYRYVILNRLVRPALERNRVWWIYHALDVGAMRTAAAALVGRHDFSAFRAAACQASSPVREIREIRIRRVGDYLYLDIAADAFLHRMVRNIMGSLVFVGMGRRPVEWIGEVLASGKRTSAGIAAPAQGLTLVHVAYPEEFALPVALLL
jgi:tRNA pseudouridine38-40 synthase